MKNILADIIFANRKRDSLTQEQYGAKYGVSGAEIFKLEKGYLRPSLALWLRMAKDAQIPERRAVLLWVKSKLPEPFQEYVELLSAVDLEAENQATGKSKNPDYAKLSTREQVTQQLTNDKTMPKGLRELFSDEELWVLYKPTGKEIHQLRDIFGPLGRGSKELFREALRLVREFRELD